MPSHRKKPAITDDSFADPIESALEAYDWEALSLYLYENKQTLDEKKNIIKVALDQLQTTADLLTQDIEKQVRFNLLIKELTRLKDTIPEEDLLLFAEFTFRANYYADKPEHQTNTLRFFQITEKVGSRSWGKVAAGIVLGLVGVSLLVAAVMLTVSTAGIGSPLSPFIAWLGKSMVGWGVGLASVTTAKIVAGATTAGVATLCGAAAAVGADYLIGSSKSKYTSLQGLAHNLFAPKSLRAKVKLTRENKAHEQYRYSFRKA